MGLIKTLQDRSCCDDLIVSCDSIHFFNHLQMKMSLFYMVTQGSVNHQSLQPHLAQKEYFDFLEEMLTSLLQRERCLETVRLA